MKYEVLLADDDDSVRLVISKALSRAGHTVRGTNNAETLLKWAAKGEGDIVITDVMMNAREIFEDLPDLAKSRPNMPIIVISANNTVSTALKSGEHGVFEYIPKPFDLAFVTDAVKRAGQKLSRRGLRNARQARRDLPMIGRSAAMQPIFRAVSRYAGGDLPVLITGAVGTGKDLIARLLHEGGPRRERPMIRTKEFGNISMTLQQVNGGDIYIDEVAELSAEQQDALLSLMSECETIPVRERPRVISATRKDLRKRVDEGLFRDDLLYRLNVAEIELPPLSARDRDIVELADSFLVSASTTPRQFEPEALDILQRHDWQGNVRELENLIRRLTVLYSDDVITAAMVLGELDKAVLTRIDGEDDLDKRLHAKCRQLLNDQTFEGSVHQVAIELVEAPLLREALRITGGNKAKAADRLGIHRNTLRTRLASLNIS